MTDDLRKLTRRELYKLVWETPVYQLAQRFGLSGRGLGKLCDRHSIPVPPRGYWAEKAAGKRVIRPPLIEVETPKPLDVSITIARKPMPKTAPAVVGAETATGADPFRELWDHLWTETGPIRVPKTLTSPHPVVAAWIAEEQQELARYRSVSGGARSRSRFDTTIERRRLRILSTLLKELAARGFSVERDRYRPLDLWVRHGRDEVRFDIKERYRQVRRNLTDAEKADRWNAGREWTQVREASGELTLKITTYGPEGIQTSWKDDASGRLEEKLQSAVVGFLVVAAYAKHRRELNEAEEHRRWEAQRAAWQLEEQKKAERARQDALVRDAENWRKAKLVRDYVEAANAACSARLGEPEVANLRAWSEWALGHAERLDPIAGGRAGRMEA